MEETKKRYTEEELVEFKEIIDQKIELATREYKTLMRAFRGEDSNDIDDTMPTYKVLEEGSSTLSKEELLIQAERQFKFIKSLQAALVRIKNGTYGIDRLTGELIPKERLRIVPHATLSVASKLKNKNH